MKSRYLPPFLQFPLDLIRGLVTSSKWILVVFYLGLIIAQVLYAYRFSSEVIHLCGNFQTLDENHMMLAVLMLVDIAMIANLIRTIIGGSYYAFIEKLENSGEKISSGYLKVKMGMSLVGISSIHLLQAFINSTSSDREIIIKCSIHMVFLISTIGLAFVEYLHEKSNNMKGESH